jgi:NADPH-dependent 2,4-dienoyl-CoA reductase/sulfur reductase-like enzyme
MGAPLAHASAPYAGKAWRRFDDIPELKGHGVRILQGTATSVDLAEKVLTFRPAPVEGAENPEKQIGYDYLVAATGLKRTWPIVPREHKKERYLEDAREFIKELENVEGNIVVVGGGE